MAIADDVTLIAAVASDDGSAIFHLVKGADDALQRIVVRRTNGSWVADAPESVTGLPDSTRRPGSATKSGATVLLTAKSDDGVFVAVSNDDMKTWAVSA